MDMFSCVKLYTLLVGGFFIAASFGIQTSGADDGCPTEKYGVPCDDADPPNSGGGVVFHNEAVEELEQVLEENPSISEEEAEAIIEDFSEGLEVTEEPTAGPDPGGEAM